MNFNFEKFANLGKSGYESLAQISNQAINGVEQVVQLNIETSRAVILDGQNHINNSLQIKDPQQILQAQSNYWQPLSEKLVNYSQNLYEISTATQKEVLKIVENVFSGFQSGVLEAVDTASKNAPKGSEAGFLALKTATEAGQSSLATVQKVVKQASEVAENSVNTVLNATSNAVRSVKKPGN